MDSVLRTCFSRPADLITGVRYYASQVSLAVARNPSQIEFHLQLLGFNHTTHQLIKNLGAAELYLRGPDISSVSKRTIKKALKLARRGKVSVTPQEIAKNLYVYSQEKKLIIEKQISFLKSVSVENFIQNQKEAYEREISRLFHSNLTPEIIAKEVQSLLENCIKDMLSFLQNRISPKEDQAYNNFAIMISGSASRMMSLLSDLDFIMVCEAKTQAELDYYEDLNIGIEYLLSRIGIKADNLARRFTKGKTKVIRIDALSSKFVLKTMQQSLYGLKSVNDVGNGNLGFIFKNKIDPWLYSEKKLRFRYWQKTYRTLLNYERARSKDVEREARAALRKLNYYLLLCQIKYEIRNKFPLTTKDILETLENLKVIPKEQTGKLLEAQSYFTNVLNEISRQKRKSKFLPSGPPYLTSELIMHKEFVTQVFEDFKKGIGHSGWKMKLIELRCSLQRFLRSINYRLHRKAVIAQIMTPTEFNYNFPKA